MARALAFTLDATQRHTMRRPAFKVEIYDVRSTTDTINDIVRGNALAALTGPRDFTDDIVEIGMEEQAGDYLGIGVAATTANVVFVDPNDQFDPFDVIVDPTNLGRYLRRGNVIRITEGDLNAPESEWIVTFTGEFLGQAGVKRTRAEGRGIAAITMKAADRSAGFLKFKSTSQNFVSGSVYKTMAETLAQNDMGLDSSEISFANWGAQTTGHKSTQFVEEETMVSIAKLMQIDGFMPRFNGEGKLTESLQLIDKGPSRAYTDDDLFLLIERPFNDNQPINRVCIIGLSAVLSKISQPQQKVGNISGTWGYFTQDEEIDVFWSDDRTQLVDNVQLNTVHSINGGLTILGGGETFATILADPGDNFDIEPTASVGATLSLSTGFAPYVIIFLTGVYVALAFLPDPVEAPPPAGAGWTFPFIGGTMVRTVALAAVLLLMSKIGRGVYDFVGEPFEYVFEEIRACAEVAGLLSWEIVETTVENHLVQFQADGDAVAKAMLFREQHKGNTRKIQMTHDLRLEPADVFETSDNRKYMIDKIKRTIRRGGGAPVAEIDGFEVTQGVLT